MLGEKHDLVHELPEFKQRIHEMKMTNQRFSHLFDKYHDLDHHVRRIEEGSESADDLYLEGLKKQRLKLKDDLFDMLRS